VSVSSGLLVLGTHAESAHVGLAGALPPHRDHKLIAYQVAAELLRLVARIRISDAELRQQARKSAKSALLNVAEGAARQTERARGGRAFADARLEP
jgi:hypothetical protein